MLKTTIIRPFDFPQMSVFETLKVVSFYPQLSIMFKKAMIHSIICARVSILYTNFGFKSVLLEK